MSDQERADIKNNNYKGVLLHGYYTYGDTPGVIAYYKSSTTQADDQGSIIQIDSNLKLEHKFLICDVAYYGLQRKQSGIPLFFQEV
ncbi:hypothetical protein [Dyadobacter subterraneus]|nr:hypothetical protein [Dyadobacter subterraneus]